MVFNATFRNISVILWWSVLLSTRRKPQTCHKSLTNFITKCCIEYTSPWMGFELASLVVIDTDCQLPYDHDHDGTWHSVWGHHHVTFHSSLTGCNQRKIEIYIDQSNSSSQCVLSLIWIHAPHELDGSSLIGRLKEWLLAWPHTGFH